MLLKYLSEEQPEIKIDPIFFYHGIHDPIVPFQHLSYYKKYFKSAIFRELEVNDHAFAKGLPQLVNDIK